MKMLKRFVALLCLLTLAACGGGGGDAGTAPFPTGGTGGTGGGGGSIAQPTIAVSLSSSTVTAGAPATVSAVVKNALGASVAGQVVSFSSTGGLGTFTPTTALTGDDGTATVQLTPALPSTNGADQVVASATVDTVAVTASIGFTVVPSSGTGATSISVALSSTTVTAGSSVTAIATLLDAAGAGLAGKVVSFSSLGGLGIFSPATALTGADGVAIVQLAPAAITTSGADDALATVTVGGTVFTARVGFTVIPSRGPVGTPSMSLTLNTATVTTTTPATATAAVKDANGGAVAGQVVKFTSSGLLGVFSPATALTDTNGNAVVALSPSAATTNGADQVVATSTISGTTLTASQGFQVRIASSDLILNLSSAQLPNTGSGSVVITATAIDSNRNTVPGVPVTFSSDGETVIAGAMPATGASGSATASLTIGANRANRLVTLTATSGSITRVATVQVVGTSISSTLVPAVIPPGTPGSVQYRVIDQAGNAMANQSVQIVATGLVPGHGTGTTGANGDFIFNYTAPAVTGTYPIVANIAGGTDSQSLQVQSAGVIAPVTVAIASASVSANPSVVSTNLVGSATNRSEIRALFLGADNLPIKNVRARFDLAGDVNSVGGTFTTGATTLYSDANGVVTTAYIPGTRSSPTDGVMVRVCYGASDTDPNFVNCSPFKSVTLTITAEPLGVSIGTNETILVEDLTYVKQFVVTVADSAGVAKPDVNLAVSLDLPVYRKGRYVVVGDRWVKNGVGGTDQASCLNEDTNRNGVLEGSEDINGDAQLWPRKPDVIVSLLQSKTGADGTAILQIRYAKDHGSWVDATITVSASGVAGSEGRVIRSVAPVPVDAASIKNVDSDPAFKVSPYGESSICTDNN